MNYLRHIFVLLFVFVSVSALWSQHANVIWNTPSRNSSESMPCGGGDIGMNIWVEEGDILFYLSRRCLIIGVANHLEIWSKQRWEALEEEQSASFEEAAEHLSEIMG